MGGKGKGGSLPDLITRFFTGIWNERKLTTSLTKIICSLRWRITGFPLRPVKKEENTHILLHLWWRSSSKQTQCSSPSLPLSPSPCMCMCGFFLSLCSSLSLPLSRPPPPPHQVREKNKTKTCTWGAMCMCGFSLSLTLSQGDCAIDGRFVRSTIGLLQYSIVPC